MQDLIHQVEDGGPDGPLGRVQGASALARELSEAGDAVLGYFVDLARQSGHSWSEIGEALGVSKQAAQQKQSVRMSLGPAGPTFERFTPRARHVVGAAEAVARSWGHGYIGTEHLLLALYCEPDGVAARVLSSSGLPAAQAEVAVGDRAERGPGAPDGIIAYTPRAAAVFTAALSAALELGHGYIGTEHLLLGLARGRGIAAQVLAEAGLTGEELAVKIAATLAAYRSEAAAPGGAHRRPRSPSSAKKGKKKTASKTSASSR